MFMHLKPSGKPPRIHNVLSALNVVEERLIINTSGGMFFREMGEEEFDPYFISKFNQRDSIYPSDSPFASFVRESHLDKRLARFDRKTGKVTYLENKWPELVGIPGIYIEDNNNYMCRVIDLYGINARTTLTVNDYALWTTYWGILDIFADAGIPTLGNDDRVPFRENYLLAYQTDRYPTHLFDGLSKEETETEIRNRVASKYSLPKWLYNLISEWVDEYPDNFYRVKFQGSLIVIDRRTSVLNIAFHAQKENHPLLKRLEGLNLV